MPRPKKKRGRPCLEADAAYPKRAATREAKEAVKLAKSEAVIDHNEDADVDPKIEENPDANTGSIGLSADPPDLQSSLTN